MKQNKIILTVTVAAVIGAGAWWAAAPPSADAHCQVPCGIYDDGARIERMYEDTTTIAKAIKLMNELADKGDAQSSQQFVRWTNVKEQHADRIISTVADYFLTQKIKPVSPDAEGYEAYLKKLADHHRVMVAAMKAKQNATPDAAEGLRQAVHVLEHYWVADHNH